MLGSRIQMNRAIVKFCLKKFKLEKYLYFTQQKKSKLEKYLYIPSSYHICHPDSFFLFFADPDSSYLGKGGGGGGLSLVFIKLLVS